jgi:purine-binding chemotaxis protein CheW
MANIGDQKASREEMRMLTFSLDSVFYGVDVHHVREVKNLENITPVPCAPHYVKGVTNLRGEVIPIIELRKRIGIIGKKESSDAGIVIIVQDKHPIGVMVDKVMEVLTLEKKDVETSPYPLINGQSEAVLGIAKHDKDLIILLDLKKILLKNDLDNQKEDAIGFQIQVNNEAKQLLT